MSQKLLLAIAILFNCSILKAANFTITAPGLVYSPSSLTVNVGDVVTFDVNFSFHPTVQVSQATWNNDGSTPLSGGFNFTTGITGSVTITSAMAGSTIYYVCSAHVFAGMKGTITVNVIASLAENQIRNFNFTVFPNPVTSNSQLNISLKKSGKTTVALYDINGRMVEQVLDKVMDAGEVTIPFRAAHLQKGAYFLLMRTPEGTLKKQILIQ